MQEEFIPQNGIAAFREAAEKLAEFGRYGDVYIVHAAEGETMVPMEVLDSNPKLKEMLFAQMREMDLNPESYIVGNELNSINPVTGQPEFFLKKVFNSVKKVLKTAAPVIGAIAGSFIPGVGPILGPAIGSFAASKLAGKSTKSALLGAALAGAGGYALSGSQAALAGGIGSGNTLGSSLMAGYGTGGTGISSVLPTFGSTVGSGTPGAVATNAMMNPTTVAGTVGNLASTAGNYLAANPGLALALGSGVVAALEKPEKISADPGPTGAETLAKDPEKYGLNRSLDAAPVVSYAPANYDSIYANLPQMYMPVDRRGVGLAGLSYPVTPYNPVVQVASGGELVGPGTGTSDSIPAMLSDGEFVMTAKAVRGAGGGDRRAGARKMYQMMKKFEAAHGG